jgi:ADP-ribose pyrophosphatase YjhB (NUDIX family)
VLPRGKLRRNERPVSGAGREVVEETGFRVKVSEFIGAITYLAGGRPKVVQFWLMQAAARQSYEVTNGRVAIARRGGQATEPSTGTTVPGQCRPLCDASEQASQKA